jgi:hypothetical protein
MFMISGWKRFRFFIPAPCRKKARDPSQAHRRAAAIDSDCP